MDLRRALAGWLLRRGLSRLEKEDRDGARRYGTLLCKLRNTGAYELFGRIALEAGDLTGAVAVLREPADRYPQAWILNSLLGQAFSDGGHYAMARERFEAVRREAGPDAGALFNLALVAGREEDHAETLNLLARSVEEGEPTGAAQIEEARAWSLLALGRLGEAEAAAREAGTSYAQSVLALILARGGRPEEAWEAVRESFRREPGHASACEATRVLLEGEGARVWTLELDGLTDPARHLLGKRMGVTARAWIVADTEEDALAIARSVEPDLLNLRVTESTWEPAGSDARRGYVARSAGHYLYRDVSGWGG